MKLGRRPMRINTESGLLIDFPEPLRELFPLLESRSYHRIAIPRIGPPEAAS